MKTYFNRINAGVKSCYDVAQDIKDLGIDPDKTCIPLAKNMAERVEGLISVIMPQIKNSGVVERIGDLEMLDKITAKSKLTKKNVLALGKKINKAAIKKFLA